MGRPKRHSGGFAIQNAEELFRQSVDAGKPDYSFVALAIGSMPGSPPLWAILECLQLRLDVQVKAARGHVNVSAVLDDIIRYMDDRQKRWWLETGGDGPGKVRPKYKPPSFRSAVLHVVKSHPAWRDFVGSADTDWMKPIREAWDWEQQHDLSSFEGGELLKGFDTTTRIDRVVLQAVAAERGDPEDVATAAWIAKTLVERQKR